MLTSFKHFRSYLQFCKARGFTLIELIVVSAIVLIITTFILFQQSKFNSSTLLRSLTYSVALSVRQAQVYGTSVRESAPGSGVFAQGYGVYFPSAGTADDDTYYMFADVDGDGAYDSGEELPSFTLGKGYRLESLCAVAVGGGTCTALTSMTVFYRRPNPDACISSAAQPAVCAVGATAAYATTYVTLRSEVDTRSIKISDTGQISICAPNLTDLVNQC